MAEQAFAGKAEPEAGAAPRLSGSRPAARYEDDVFTWVQEQVGHLRAGRIDALDLANIAEELSDVNLSEYYRLQSAVEVVVIHLLKWDHQPDRRSRSWTLSIAEHRERVAIYLRKNPGLKSSLAEMRQDAFRVARVKAAKQMKRPLKSLPVECPYTWDEILCRPIVLDDEE